MIWLRVAAGLVLLHGVLHTVVGVFGEVPPGPQPAAVAAMKLNRFVAVGVSRTYWDLRLRLWDVCEHQASGASGGVLATGYFGEDALAAGAASGGTFFVAYLAIFSAGRR